MSSITPASFIDDGISFTKRIPTGLHPAHITQWLDTSTSTSDTTSVYTGSYIDDGADMLLPPPAAPGFGALDARFYKQRKRRENEQNALWNEDIGKAVAGDMKRCLEGLRGVAGVHVKRAGEVGGDGDGGENKGRDRHGRKKTVTIPLPMKWGTFVIKGDDGRVIVVDEEGEFDSGVPQVTTQEEQGERWVKAPMTISAPSSVPVPSERRHSRTRKDIKKSKPLKALTPITESEYEDGYQPSIGEDIASPTGFFMTGGKDGWPERSETSVVEPKISVRSSSSRHSSPLKPTSPVREPPGSWPSPTLEATKTSSVSTGVEEWGEKKSHRSSRKSHTRSHKSSRREADDVSAKSYSTYRPATVEDAPSPSSENASVKKDAGWGGWGGSKAGSENSWSGSKHGKDSEHSWLASPKKGSHKSSHHSDAWTDSQPASEHNLNTGTSVQNWIGDKVKTVSEASSHKSRHRSHRSHSRSHAPSEQRSTHRSRSRSHAPTEASWDGYELPKTQSEVSLAGSGSYRDERASRVSSRHHSHKSSQNGWETGSDQWAGSQKANVGGWTSSESGGYGEDDGAYLNKKWSGVRVRVGRRRGVESGSGWE